MTSSREALAEQLLRTRVGRYVLLVSLVVEIFVIPPLVSMGDLPRWIQAGAFSVTMVVGLYALTPRGVMRGIVMCVAASALVARWVAVGLGASAVILVQAATAGVATASFAAVLLRDAFSKGRFPDRLLAVLLAYILLGTTWAQMYVFLDVVYPGALHLPGAALTMSEFLYFSFVTLTSVGYGDIVPVHPIARSLAALEALVGQIFLVAIVSRFVGVGLAGSRDSAEV